MIEAFRNCELLDHEDNMPSMFDISLSHLKRHYDLLDGHMLEFGVFDATSINRTADLWPDRQLFGFDSFEGLPEDWDLGSKVYTKNGKWHLNGKLPEVRSNVTLIKGFFDDTLENWWKANQGQIGFLHVDCDLYSSTKTVLSTLNDGIVPGTIIRFDDLIDFREFENYEGKGSHISKYTTWRQHEWRAFEEWLDTFDRKVVPLYRGWFQWAVVRVTQ
ncbi:MAG: hypothetical protein Aurels2KO_21240 [Aureliella sp.]